MVSVIGERAALRPVPGVARQKRSQNLTERSSSRRWVFVEPCIQVNCGLVSPVSDTKRRMSLTVVSNDDELWAISWRLGTNGRRL